MEENTNLDLNTDAIRERSGIRSSLTDMNEIPVFSDLFQEKKEQAGRAQAAEKEALSGIVFEGQVIAAQGDVISEKLFLTRDESLVIRNDTAGYEQTAYEVGAVLMFVAVLAAGVFFLFRKRGGKKNDVNNQPARAI